MTQNQPIDWRGLCQKLVGTLEVVQLGRPFSPAVHQLCQRAREALAQPEPEDDVALLRAALKATAEQRRAEDDARAALAETAGEGVAEDELWDIGERHLWTGTDESATNYRILTSFIEAARAVLARWGHQPAPPAAGEVGELVAWLRDRAESTSLAHNALRITRAADLLERQAAPVPVAVSERLPQAEDCDAEGRCWTYEGKYLPSYMAGPWVLREPPKVSDYFWRNVTHWLPARDLPLPIAEV